MGTAGRARVRFQDTLAGPVPGRGAAPAWPSALPGDAEAVPGNALVAVPRTGVTKPAEKRECIHTTNISGMFSKPQEPHRPHGQDKDKHYQAQRHPRGAGRFPLEGHSPWGSAGPWPWPARASGSSRNSDKTWPQSLLGLLPLRPSLRELVRPGPAETGLWNAGRCGRRFWSRVASRSWLRPRRAVTRVRSHTCRFVGGLASPRGCGWVAAWTAAIWGPAEPGSSIR